MKHLLRAIVCVMTAGFMFGTPTAYAAPITGSVTFGGTVQPAGGMGFDTATGVNILGDVAFVTCAAATTCSGTYAPVTGAVLAVYNDFSYDPLGGTVTPLWSFSFGGVDYSFNLESVTIVDQLPNFLNLTGMGTLMATGYEDTPGLWSFSADRASGTVNAAFSATNDVPPSRVPEPASMTLLGLGMLGAAVMVRRRRRLPLG